MTWDSYTDFVARHPYLMAHVGLVALAMLVLRYVPKRRRRIACWFGAACVPGAVINFAEWDYWCPVRWLGGSLGPEDILFDFLNGLIVGLMVPIPWPAGQTPPSHPRLRRYLPLTSAAMLLFAGLISFGVSVFVASLWVMAVWSAGLLALRPRNIVPAAWVLCAFVPIYWAIVRVQFFLWPHYVHQWDPVHPLGFVWLGVPVGELVWAAVFGVFWPALMLFVLEPPALAPATPAADHSASSSRK
jgi:hypothetical protein